MLAFGHVIRGGGMGVVGEVSFWVFVFLATAGLLFCSVYSLILFSDLSVDHINPIELCELINRLVVPEYIGHAIVTTVLLLRGLYIPALLNVPLVAVHASRYKEQRHLLDNTAIFNDVKKERKFCEIKLVYHLFMFFVYLYYFIMALIAD